MPTLLPQIVNCNCGCAAAVHTERSPGAGLTVRVQCIYGHKGPQVMGDSPAACIAAIAGWVAQQEGMTL